MIDFYTWKTPNGRKIAIMLEETHLPYQLHSVDISKDEQFDPKFLKLNPNNKIPVIVDQQGPDNKPITIFESGAILIYLAQKTGKFLPTDVRGMALVNQWLMFQMASVGPMFGQLNHFMRAAPTKIDYAIDRYRKEALRIYGVLNQRLGEAQFLANEFSIADIATFPWVAIHEWQEIKLDEFPHVKRWFETIQARPATERGMKIPA